MKRPVEISVGRLVLPTALRGQEQAFSQALGRAVDQRAAGAVAPVRDKVAGAADRAAAAILASTRGRFSDG